MSRSRRGFTFIELLVVIIVLGLLAALATLKYIDLKNRALTAQAAADMEAIRLAAYGAWYETGIMAWGSRTGRGASGDGDLSPEELQLFSPGVHARLGELRATRRRNLGQHAGRRGDLAPPTAACSSPWSRRSATRGRSSSPEAISPS